MANGYFDYSQSDAGVRGLTASLRRLAADSWRFLLASAVALVVMLAFGLVLTLLGIGSDAVILAASGLGGGVSGGAVFLFFRSDPETPGSTMFDFEDRKRSVPDTSSSIRSPWDLLLPVGLGFGVVAASPSGALSNQPSWFAASLALGLWSSRVASTLDKWAERASFIDERRDVLLEALSIDEDTLSKHGLSELLPQPSPFSRRFYDRAAVGSVVVGWGVSSVGVAVFAFAALTSSPPSEILVSLRWAFGATLSLSALCLCASLALDSRPY